MAGHGWPILSACARVLGKCPERVGNVPRGFPWPQGQLRVPTFEGQILHLVGPAFTTLQDTTCLDSVSSLQIVIALKTSNATYEVLSPPKLLALLLQFSLPESSPEVFRRRVTLSFT